jgi:anti-sigma regulatory factor (Ser/Thr protein kinase)
MPGGQDSTRVGVEVTDPPVAGAGLHHLALFYESMGDYLTALQQLVDAAAERDEPVLMTVPAARLSWLRGELSFEPGRVAFADMTELGRNPARIIPSLRAFADQHPQQRVWSVGEPAWAGRSAAELCEVTRYEALTNAAFAGAPATRLCPYDVTALPEPVLANAARTHPSIARHCREAVSASYLQPPRLPPGCDIPIPPPPATAERLAYEHDLRPVRAMIARSASRAGLAAERVTDLVIAASEVAANTLRHTRAGGTAHVWHTGREIICQLHDTGVIEDPLACSRLPAGDLPGGKGLWLVNQVCDLVELRSASPAGSTIRLHMNLG